MLGLVSPGETRARRNKVDVVLVLTELTAE
jgi:hypothetical protein